MTIEIPHIGPNNQNTSGLDFLNDEGSVYSNYVMVNAIRMRALNGVPSQYIKTLSVEKKDDFEKNLQTKNINFCILQKDDSHVPVFMLPATEELTGKLDNAARIKHMQTIFEQCYAKYKSECEKNSVTPVPAKDCAATVVAGTKTLFGGQIGKLFKNDKIGNHFTTMIKLPGTNNEWSHVDPTSLFGPQRFNRKQCGGYSSMIEAEAVGFYASKKITEAQNDAKAGYASGKFKQWLREVFLKIKTWFAGKIFGETSYGEMADFSAHSLAKTFDNKNISMEVAKPNHQENNDDDAFDEISQPPPP